MRVLTDMIRLDDNVQKSLHDLLDSMRQTEIFQNYVTHRQCVDAQPELKRQIDEYRHKNLEIQQNYQGEELLRRMEEFEIQYESLCANPLVDHYLSAELALVRMYQAMERQVLEALELR